MADKIKVLHVLGGLDRGGVETWLMHVLRHIDRDRFQLDFLVSTTRECAYDREAKALGSLIIPNPDPHNPLLYALNFMRNYRKYGPYDIVHSHVHHYSGFVLFLSRILGVPIRIAHSHNDTRVAESNNSIFRKIYLHLMKKMINTCATHGIAASSLAAEDLFGMDWERDQRWKVLHCGIDLEPFKKVVDRAKIRRELGIPTDAFVVGHVGRFVEQKNHSFLLDIAANVIKSSKDVYFLLVGDGPLRPAMEQKAKVLNIKDKVIFTGVRQDVPDLMLGAFDLILFPSLHEGLGIVLIEAQAAGLHCILSDVIPKEVDICKDLITRLNLTLPITLWADNILRMKYQIYRTKRNKYLDILERSPFNIVNITNRLLEIYNKANNVTSIE